ncbi:hypothetical protein GJ496_003556, partial [Pomphorhynchus laevis]
MIKKRTNSDEHIFRRFTINRITNQWSGPSNDIVDDVEFARISSELERLRQTKTNLAKLKHEIQQSGVH